jgi:hypothetical protein
VAWRTRVSNRIPGVTQSNTHEGIFGGAYEVVEDLVADDACHFEALLAGDRVDDQVAVDADEVLRVKNAVLILQEAHVVSGLVRSLTLPSPGAKAARAARQNNACMAGAG